MALIDNIALVTGYIAMTAGSIAAIIFSVWFAFVMAADRMAWGLRLYKAVRYWRKAGCPE